VQSEISSHPGERFWVWSWVKGEMSGKLGRWCLLPEDSPTLQQPASTASAVQSTALLVLPVKAAAPFGLALRLHAAAVYVDQAVFRTALRLPGSGSPAKTLRPARLDPPFACPARALRCRLDWGLVA
jgi:hypothetical protein